MNILVTGSSGYIGSRLAVMAHEAFPDADFTVSDIKDGQDYAELMDGDYDVVFHLGAETDLLGSFESADKMMMVNAFNLIPFLRFNLVKKFILASTAAIYGNMSRPMREDEAKWMDALCPYAQSKYVAEEIIRKVCPNHVITRFGNVFGGDYSHRRENWLAPTHFMHDDPIVLYGGTQVRDFIHVDTVCQALINAAKSDVTGTFNISSGLPMRLFDMAVMFAEKRGVSITFAPHRTGDAVYVVLDVSKAKSAGLLPEKQENDYLTATNWGF